MADERAVLCEKKGRVATVRLCNAAKRNAMGPAFWEELPAVMAQIGADDALAAVLLCADGPAFSVGLDLVSMATMLTPGAGPIAARQRLLPEIERLQRAINAVADCPLPVISVLHGYCLGGAVDLATACDVRIAADDLVLSVREIRMAIVADIGTLQRLPRIIGPGHVAELAFTGKDIDAKRCHDIGLVNATYPTVAAAQEAGLQMAQEIAENSPLVVRGIKRVLRYSAEHSVRDGLEHVALWNSAFLLSDDLNEAFAAFAEKRKPSFQGS